MSAIGSEHLVWPSLPTAVTDSRLYRNAGLLFVDFPGPQGLEALRAEALEARSQGWRNEWWGPDVAEERGGNPSRAFSGAQAGPIQWNLFSAPTAVEAIGQACGLEVEPTGGGTYSYYERPGDFLALHRDIETCDLTVITCLWDCEPGERSGALLVYGEHINQPIAAAHASGRSSAVAACLRPGQSAILLGGVVPHEVSPVAEAQERIVSVMCYRIHGMS